MRTEKDGIAQWDNHEIEEKRKDDSLVFVDVREPEEYEEGHIPGVPLMPMSEIPERLPEMDKERTHVFICRSGNRSQKVAQFAKENGFDRVVNYDGGMLSWHGDLQTGEEIRVKDTTDLYKS